MKSKLENLYKEYQPKFESIVNRYPDVNIAGPLLISPNYDFETQQKRLLIIGQQTNGWGYHSNNILAGMNHYQEFNLGVNYYSSPFWNITRKVERLLGSKEYSCAWTNISKYDVNAKRPVEPYLSEISKIDDLLIKEIEILKPDMILFFTGPDLDNRIKNLFNSVEFENIKGFKSREFARLKHDLLSKNTFRSHQPTSLRFRKLEEPFLKYLKENN